MHQDVAGRDFDGWHNFWLLLSDGVHGRPLALLDPRGLAAAGERSWRGERVLTHAGMRRGDMLVWRSNRVPHATGRLVEAAAVAGDDAHALHAPPASWEAPAQRSSFDFRCRCVERGAAPELQRQLREFDID